eukprot:94957-Pelagomonas_calceolata.AAC.2
MSGPTLLEVAVRFLCMHARMHAIHLSVSMPLNSWLTPCYSLRQTAEFVGTHPCMPPVCIECPAEKAAVLGPGVHA